MFVYFILLLSILVPFIHYFEQTIVYYLFLRKYLIYLIHTQKGKIYLKKKNRWCELE